MFKDCPDGQGSHRVKDYIDTSSGLDNIFNRESLLVVGFAQSNCEANVLAALARVCNQFKQREDFSALTIAGDSLASRESQQQLKQSYLIPDGIWTWHNYRNITDLINCGFNLEIDCGLSQQLVLLDKNSQIRGYYQVDDSEELDRLITEINILFLEYSDK